MTDTERQRLYAIAAAKAWAAVEKLAKKKQ